MSLPKFHPSRGLLLGAVLATISAFGASAESAPIGTSFSYQGNLSHNGTPVDGLVDLRFGLFDAVSGGTPLGTLVELSCVQVVDGDFATELDFGVAAFGGDARWLGIEVRAPCGSGAYTTLTPRQPVLATPVAQFALAAAPNQNIDASSITSGNLSAARMPRGGTWTLQSPLDIQADSVSVSVLSGAGSASLTGDRLTITHATPRLVLKNESEIFNSSALRFEGPGASYSEIVKPNHAARFRLTTHDGDAFTSSLTLLPTGHLNLVGNGKVQVSIGTSDPRQNLHVMGLDSEASSSGSVPDGIARFQGEGTTGGLDIGYRSSPAHAWLQARESNDFAADHDLALNPNGGNVGVGITTPAAPLHVAEGSAGVTPSPSASLILERNASANYLQMLALDSSELGVMFGKPQNGASGGVYYNSGSTPNGLNFRTNGNQARMVVTSAGLVGIGTTTPTQTLSVNGSAGKPGGGSWSTFSDERLKKHVRPVHRALEQLLALRGVSFEYIDPIAIGEPAGTRIGMIAQQVESVFPEWVSEAPTGYKTLTFSGFEALTVEALRDLRLENEAEIDRLRVELAEVRARNDALSGRLARLEDLVRFLTGRADDPPSADGNRAGGNPGAPTSLGR